MEGDHGFGVERRPFPGEEGEDKDGPEDEHGDYVPGALGRAVVFGERDGEEEEEDEAGGDEDEADHCFVCEAMGSSGEVGGLLERRMDDYAPSNSQNQYNARFLIPSGTGDSAAT